MNRGLLPWMVLTGLMSTGCLMTYQTARVLPRGETVSGVGVSLPPMVEYYYRRGLGGNMEGSIKLGSTISPTELGILPIVFGELKYQIPSPFIQARSLVAGGGAFVGDDGKLHFIFYPTYLVSSGDYYGGVKLITIPKDIAEGYYLGLVVGRVYHLNQARVKVFPEVSIIQGGDVLGLSAGIGIQRWK